MESATILVIDDQEPANMVLKRALGTLAIRSLRNNGRQGLDLFRV